MAKTIISKADLECASASHFEDAVVLMNHHRYDGAIYLFGYVIELLLKVRICDRLKWDVYPNVPNGNSFTIHELRSLLMLSGKDDAERAALRGDFDALNSWSPEIRYSRAVPKTQNEAKKIYEAVVNLRRTI